MNFIDLLFLQLKHQYRVIGESGLPHEKNFTVCLELGDEKYKASGRTIKMAQQAAATKALSETKHQRPAGRQTRSTFSRKSSADRPGEFFSDPRKNNSGIFLRNEFICIILL